MMMLVNGIQCIHGYILLDETTAIWQVICVLTAFSLAISIG
ncbi:hypothetical protein [Rhodoferax sp. U11-2br]|nr:hypothetical protein [Rhodoferax sp. U11-2br]